MSVHAAIPTFIPRTVRTKQHQSTSVVDKALMTGAVEHDGSLTTSKSVNHTIFEGTSEIQQLVIARAISGMRIE